MAEVFLAMAGGAEGFQKPVALKPVGGAQWKVSVPLAPGTYHYRFLVDGEWRDDPESTLRVPNPFGSQNAVRKVA